MRYTYERIGVILKELSEARYLNRRQMSGWQMKKIDDEMSPAEAEKLAFEEVPCTEIWGGDNEYYAFRTEVVIPEDLDGKTVEIEIRTGKEGEWDAENPQFTAYVNGEVRQGLDVNHRTIRLGESVRAGETFKIFLSAFTGTQKINFHLLFDATLYGFDTELNKFYYDMLIPWEICGLLDANDDVRIHYLTDLNSVINILDLRRIGSESFYASVAEAGKTLDEMYARICDPDSEPVICCIGHTHIDVAWLWTLAVTRDKSVRSFSTVLELMRRYPEYKFMSSQPQLYAYVKETHPEVFEQIKQRVKEGRWEVEGGMYVEADCNLSSGESLIRQFLYGKRFFKDEFDKDNEVLWLPDAFGYSAALPQIMEKSGIRYFMTTKISWNDTDLLPVDTFVWKGIDGTGILTHLIPTRDFVVPGRSNSTSGERNTAFTTNYNGFLNPSQMKGAWQRYQQKDLNNEVLCSYGYGDGGGGSTEDMIETGERLNKGLPGCPRTKFDTVENFFHRLEKDTEGKDVPIWNGELYLEYHRGTYTSMGRNKKYNRKSEFALQNLESLETMGLLLANADYHQSFLEDQWKIVLINQFHDILPGSAIEPVYEESRQQYLALFEAVGEKTEKAEKLLADAAGHDLVFNMNGKELSGYVLIPDNAAYPQAQKTYDGQYLAWAEKVPSKGYKAMADEQPSCGTGVTVLENGIETPFAKVTFDGKGRIVSWFDKAGDREILQEGKIANRLVAYEDRPFEYDNWNLESYYKEKSWDVDDLVSSELVEEGPYRFTYRFTWKYEGSDLVEYVSFYANSPQVDFSLDVDWKEVHTLLKVLFPVELNANKATYEIQYGNVERTTTRNISWEQAKFEVCHHKWMDLAEGDFGVSFMNDCKFGVSVENNEVGLTLLRCGTYPNPHADQEQHHMVYSVMPHTGTWMTAGTVDKAYLLNNPLSFGKAEKSADAAAPAPLSYSLASCAAENIMVEVVKKADRSDDLVIRMYEFGNRRTKTSLKLNDVVKGIWDADMMENRTEMLGENTDSVELTFKPFEIKTILIER